MGDEKKPLLGIGGGAPLADATPSAPVEPPPYEEPTVPAPYAPMGPTPGAPAYPGGSGGSGSESGPPPYSTFPQRPGLGQSLFVQCRVCQHVIHVAPGTQSRVVKCSNCREATPIAPPPAGKKYVRCPCNCLLTCSETASRVICPRENCKRTIGVGTIDVRPINTDRMRVICGRCHRSILWPSNATVARCPHCRGRSYLYGSWMHYRAGVTLTTGAILVALSVIITAICGATNWAVTHGGIFVIWIVLFFIGIGLIVRGIFYCLMTQSRLE